MTIGKPRLFPRNRNDLGGVRAPYCFIAAWISGPFLAVALGAGIDLTLGWEGWGLPTAFLFFLGWNSWLLFYWRSGPREGDDTE